MSRNMKKILTKELVASYPQSLRMKKNLYRVGETKAELKRKLKVL